MIGIISTGIACPLGLGVAPTVERWLAGDSGLVDNDRWPTDWFVRGDAGLVPDFKPRKQLPDRKAVKLMSRESQLAVWAAVEAAGPKAGPRFEVNPLRFGGFAAAGYEVSSLDESEEMLALARDPDDPRALSLKELFGPARDAYSPLAPLKILPNMALFHAASTLDLRGPHLSLGSSAAAGLAALGEAVEALQHDEADAVLVLGSDAQTEVFRAHQSTEAGVIEHLAPAEGAGALVVAEGGVAILGWAVGQELPSDEDPREASGRIVHGEARARIYAEAMKQAGLTSVDLALADLWGWPERDEHERRALPHVDRAASTRTRMGWLGAAAGVIDVALAVELIRGGHTDTVIVTASGLAGDVGAVVLGAAR